MPILARTAPVSREDWSRPAGDRRRPEPMWVCTPSRARRRAWPAKLHEATDPVSPAPDRPTASVAGVRILTSYVTLPRLPLLLADARSASRPWHPEGGNVLKGGEPEMVAGI